MQQSNLNPTGKNFKVYHYKWASNSIILALVIWLGTTIFYKNQYTFNSVINLLSIIFILSFLVFFCIKKKKWVKWVLLLYILYTLTYLPLVFKYMHLSNFYIGYLLHILFLILSFVLMFVKVK